MIFNLRWLSVPLIAFLFIFASREAACEEILLQQTTTQHYGGGFKDGAQTRNYMPGNDKFGFFYRAESDSKGTCRIRSKISCDYGMLVTKELRSRAVEISIDGRVFGFKTDQNGIVDMLFHCEREWQKAAVSLTVGGYEKKFVLESAAQEHRIPESQCSEKKNDKSNAIRTRRNSA